MSEDVGHVDFGRGKMVPGLKQIYTDLGYVSSASAFNALETNYLEYGSLFYFDQEEFVDVSTIPFAES